MKELSRKLDVYRLAVKYWLQGDDWQFATSYAKRIVYGFKRG